MMATNWDTLPDDVHNNILNKLEFKDLFRCKTLSQAWKIRIESDDYCRLRGETSSQEGSFTSICYDIVDNTWQCFGYDLHLKSWRLLPPFWYLPPPDAQYSKEYFITGHHSLMCAQVSKLPKQCLLVVFNPLTSKKRVLPPLLYPRNPKLVHISVRSTAKFYTIVVVGSSSKSEKHLAKKVEVFHSTTSKWTEASDLPGPVFGLNHYQAGVSVNGVLYIIAFLDGNGRRGVVAFDMENGEWSEDMACATPFASLSATLQLVECNGKVHLYSMQMHRGLFRQCFHVLERPSLKGKARAWHWREVIQVTEYFGHMNVLSKYSCVSFGDGKLCVFDTLSRNGVVYDMRDGKEVSILEAPFDKGEKYFTLNPASFSLQPNFDSNPWMSSAVETI